MPLKSMLSSLLRRVEVGRWLALFCLTTAVNWHVLVVALIISVKHVWIRASVLLSAPCFGLLFDSYSERRRH